MKSIFLLATEKETRRSIKAYNQTLNDCETPAIEVELLSMHV